MRRALTALLVLGAIAGQAGTAGAAEPPALDPCQALSTARFDVEVLSRRAECPRVRRVVRAWHDQCVTAAGQAQPCRAAGFRCAPADGARLSRIAGVACWRKRAEIDLVIRRLCEGGPRIHAHDVSVRAITTDCATAHQVGRAWVARKGCRGCRVDGWRCRGLPESTTTRCLRPEHPRQALELDEVVRGAAFDSAASVGGSYEGEVAVPCDRSCAVFLVTAGDGRSLTAQSIVAAPCDLAEAAGGFNENAPRGTPVRPDRSFRWRTRFQVVQGRFSADGRTVSGTSRFFGIARSDCSSETTAFSARLVRRAKQNGTCEKLIKGRLDIEVFVRGMGCTKATHVVDGWRLDRDCVTTSLDLRPCRVAGRSCTPVDGGRLRNLAGVACAAGRSEIELVIKEQCGQLDFSHSLAAINATCATARSVGRSWRGRFCGTRCTAAGWACRRLTRGPRPPTWRCRRGHSAVEISARIVIESS